MKSSIRLWVIPMLLCWPACQQPEEPLSEVSVEVRTEQVLNEDVQAQVSAPATLFPKSEVRLASRLTAPIERLEAGKGDPVERGQALVRLQSLDLEAQCAEAEAQVADAQANLDKLSAGTLPADLERARGEVERSAAALAQAEQIYQRRTQLVAEGALPERELLVSKTLYEQARTEHRVAEKSLHLLESHSRQQDLRISESRLKQAQARLAYLQAQLGYAVIRSPSQGVITEQFQYPGDMARPDTPIFTLMDLSVAVARGQFPDEKAAEVKPGQPCWFEKLDAPGVSFAGRTTVVSQAADAIRRTVEVWCEIPNPESQLKAGLFGQVTVVTGVRRAAATVPLACVDLDEGRAAGVVWTVSADKTAHKNQVVVGQIRQGRAEILEGLKGGETVVVEGSYGLYEGVRLHLAPADAEKPR